MSEVLTKIFKILQKLSTSSYQSLRNILSELESLILALPNEIKPSYQLLLVEQYVTNLNDYDKAESILSILLEQNQPEYSLQVQLYFLLIRCCQQKYSMAIKYFYQSKEIVFSKTNLTQIAYNFYLKMLGLTNYKRNNQNQNRNYERNSNRNYNYKNNCINQNEQFHNNNNKPNIIIVSLWEQQIYKNYIFAFKMLYQEIFQKQVINIQIQYYQYYKRIVLLWNLIGKQRQNKYINNINRLKHQISLMQSKNNLLLLNFNSKIEVLTQIIKTIHQYQDKILKPTNQQDYQLRLLSIYKLKKAYKSIKDRESRKMITETIDKLSNQSQNIGSQKLNYEFVGRQYELCNKMCLLLYFNHFKIQLQNQIRQYSQIQNLGLKSKINHNNNHNNINFSKYNKTVNHSNMNYNNNINFLQNNNEDDFIGSFMHKIHYSSEGSEQRYFYLSQNPINSKSKLFYCNDKQQKSKNNNFYSLKGMRRLKKGKKTQALKRKQCRKFQSNQCFSLIFKNGEEQRNFYVPEISDYYRWIQIIENFLGQSELKTSKYNSKFPEKSLISSNFKNKSKYDFIQNSNELVSKIPEKSVMPSILKSKSKYNFQS